MRTFSKLACSIIVLALCLNPVYAADWLTFGGNSQRQGYNAAETILNPTNVSGLRLQWSRKIGAGGAQTQPVLAENISVDGSNKSILFVAGNRGVLNALDAATGSIVWSVQLTAMQSCGSKWRGIGGTPTIDRVTSRIYVVDAGGLLHALDLASGAEAPSYPVQVLDQPNQAPNAWSHASPTLVGSTLYIATSSMCPDTPPYQGELIAVDTLAATVTGRYFPLGSSGPSGGGIWGPGGASASVDGSQLYVATGNAVGVRNGLPGAEAVIALDPLLNVAATHEPLAGKKGDLDFGATPLVFQVPGCTPLLAVLSKSGAVFLYDPAAISNGPLQTLQVGIASGTAFLQGVPAFSPPDRAIYFASGSDAPDGSLHSGLIALSVSADCRLAPLWNRTPSEVAAARTYSSTPVIVANGVVWMTYSNGADAQLLAYASDTGAELWRSGTQLKPTAILGPPLAVNGQVFVNAGAFMFAFGL